MGREHYPLVVRADESHIAGIAEIENREILSGFAHFGVEPVSREYLSESLRTSCLPWLVAIAGSEVAGFCRANPWKAREGYRHTMELGVYVSPAHQGKGIGRALYGEMLPIMREAKIHTVLAGIALPNPASVRLHEGFGFVRVATLPEVGFKLGEWRDVGYWALQLPE